MTKIEIDLPCGTKSIRSYADLDEYLDNLSNDRLVELSRFYSPTAKFKWSGHPDRGPAEFITWLTGVHSLVHETVSLDRGIFNPEKNRLSVVLTVRFRGKENVHIDNFADRFGPVWPDHGPTVRAHVWYTLDQDGYIIEAEEDLVPLEILKRPRAVVASSL